jgi:hypothetical protein
MINGVLRPWGRVEWLLGMPQLKTRQWLLVGSVSTQDRCNGLLQHRGSGLRIERSKLLEISDSDNAPPVFTSLASARLLSNRRLALGLAPPDCETIPFELLSPLGGLRRLVKSWASYSNGNVLFDVSAIPERFFFPMLRWLLEEPVVENLVVTYMQPDLYTSEDLGYDSQEWGPLTTFVTGAEVQHVIVGVGFAPYSLTDWLKKTYSTPDFKISLLLPFPAPPTNVSRAWDFIRRIESDLGPRDERQIVRVAPTDLWAAFQRIQSLTRNGRAPAVFAPYGPKAHSLAMCLHAIKHSAEVYFTQPTYYHPEYSSGVKLDGGLPVGHAYAIRLNGKDFF